MTLQAWVGVGGTN